MDLNKLVEIAQSGEIKVKDLSSLEKNSNTRQKYLDFKYATPKERERIAQENETTPERFQDSLLMFAKLRKEIVDGDEV